MSVFLVRCHFSPSIVKVNWCKQMKQKKKKTYKEKDQEGWLFEKASRSYVYIQ